MTEREKQRALVGACFENLNKARELLHKHPDWLHCKDGVGETAFHYLVVENQLASVKVLLEAGADLNEPDGFGTTPLMNAVFLGHREMVGWLLDRCASIEGMNQTGWTALSLATKNEKAWAFQRLIQLPRKHPIDHYYDDLEADEVFKNSELVMRDHLISLGLTRRGDDCL